MASESHLVISGALLLIPEQRLPRQMGVSCTVKRHRDSGNVVPGHGHMGLMRPPCMCSRSSIKKNAHKHRQQKAGAVRTPEGGRQPVSVQDSAQTWSPGSVLSGPLPRRRHRDSLDSSGIQRMLAE